MSLINTDTSCSSVCSMNSSFADTSISSADSSYAESAMEQMVEQHADKDHSLTAFADALTDHLDDLTIIGLQAKAWPKEKEGLHLETVPLSCIKCGSRKTYAKPAHLMDHIMAVHASKLDLEVYEKCHKEVVDAASHQLLKDSTTKRMEQTLLTKKIERRDLGVRVSATSPLASFVSQRLLQVFMDRKPAGVRGRMLTATMKIDGVVHDVFFSYHLIDEEDKLIKDRKEAKEKALFIKKLVEDCHVVQLPDRSILMKPIRTREEDVTLAKALGLLTATASLMNEVVMAYMSRHPNKVEKRGKGAQEAVEGEPQAKKAKKSREEKALESTLAEKHTVAVGRKRARVPKVIYDCI